jgi:hypothetical protein
MEEKSEEQVVTRLFDLENDGQATQRAELTGERFISLIQDPANGTAYVFQHGLDETEGAEVPPGTEFWEYPTLDEAQRATRSWSRKTGRPASWWRPTPMKASATRRPAGPRSATVTRRATTIPLSRTVKMRWGKRPKASR